MVSWQPPAAPFEAGGEAVVVATATGVSLAGVGPYTLFTVPSGKTLVLFFAVLRGTPGSAFNSDGFYQLLRLSDGATLCMGLSHRPMSADSYQAFDAPANCQCLQQGSFQVFAGDGVQLVLGSPDSNPLATVDVDLVGYLF